MGKTEYADKVILTLRSKYREKQDEQLQADKEIIIGGKRLALHREILFDGKCSILLPEIMIDMDYLNKRVRYRSQNRPQIIKTDYESGATITFSLLSGDDMAEVGDISSQLEKMRNDIRKIWKQNVFYDKGEILANELSVVWMDFKAFCLDGGLYVMLFIFNTETQTVLGNFHCSFPQYDIWKAAVLNLLATVQKGGGNSERVPD